MRASSLLITFCLAGSCLAQNWYVPDNDATLGTCNVIPFGSSPGSSFAYCRYQSRFTAADLGALPNLITGLGYAACNPGRVHYDQIEIVLDHIPAAQPLSTTFDNNLTPAAQTVLNATNYTWNTTANVWNEIGLETFFFYNGVDDVVMQITTTNGNAPAGFHRATRERVYTTSATGPLSPTGSSGLAAAKVEVSMLMARTSSHGDGCPGSNGTPLLDFTGSAQAGNTISFDLHNGVQNGISLFIGGNINSFPFPLDLVILGAPGCYAYTDIAFTSAQLLDGGGAGSLAFPIPPGLSGFRFFGQYAVLDPAANLFGFTTSNYLNVLTGN